MALTREAVRESVERAGDEHWRALIAHHEDQYPASPPTPGEVCRLEATRLNELGLGTDASLELVESRVRRVGNEVELTHVFRNTSTDARQTTEPFRNYGP
ncbi:MAG TPA: hypothetical protein VJ672_16485 [Gemmatimonadaceae bacterium]|nr:hypothetical protein [Gemmatimonadaceae bacterium]